MKSIIYSLLGLSLVMMSACINTLDTHPTTVFDAATGMGKQSNSRGFINATYSDSINSGYAGSGSCVAWEARTPNGVKCSQVGEGIDGTATELGLSSSNDWGVNRFGLLRRCNLIITNVSNSKILSEAEKNELSAHGCIMRGMIFFDQTRKMGRLCR